MGKLKNDFSTICMRLKKTQMNGILKVEFKNSFWMDHQRGLAPEGTRGITPGCNTRGVTPDLLHQGVTPGG